MRRAKPAPSGLWSRSRQTNIGIVGYESPIESRWVADTIRPEYLPLISGVCVNVRWRDIAPNTTTTGEHGNLARLGSDGNALLNRNWIDRALDDVEQHNRTVRSDQRMRVKIRQWNGFNSPANIITYLAGRGATLSIYDDSGGGLQTVPRPWHPDYIRLYEAYQTRLAALYDDHPLVASVTIAGDPLTTYPETFLRRITQSAFANTTLNGNITSGATSLTLTSGTGFGTAGILNIRANSGDAVTSGEFFNYTRSGTTVTIISRGLAGGVAASAWSNGAYVEDYTAGFNWLQLDNAGFTWAIDDRIKREFCEMHFDIWKRTPSTVSLNPWERFKDSGSGGAGTSNATRLIDGFADSVELRRFMRWFRATGRDKAVIGNDSARASYLDAGVTGNSRLFYEMSGLGWPNCVQTAVTNALVEDEATNGGRGWSALLGQLADRRVGCVELADNFDARNGRTVTTGAGSSSTALVVADRGAFPSSGNFDITINRTTTRTVTAGHGTGSGTFTLSSAASWIAGDTIESVDRVPAGSGASATPYNVDTLTQHRQRILARAHNLAVPGR